MLDLGTQLLIDHTEETLSRSQILEYGSASLSEHIHIFIHFTLFYLMRL